MSDGTFLMDDNSYLKRLVSQQVYSPEYVIIKRKSKQIEPTITTTNNNNNNNGNDDDDDAEYMDIDENTGKMVYRKNTPGNNGSAKKRKGPGDLFGSSLFDKSDMNSLRLTPVKGQSEQLTSTYSAADRFIPLRDYEDACTRYALFTDDPICEVPVKKKENAISETKDVIGYTNLLQNELLGSNIENIPVTSPSEDKRIAASSAAGGNNSAAESNDSVATNSSKVTRNLFSFRRKVEPTVSIDATAPYSLSPIGIKSQKLLRSPRKATRKISRIPFKVLDAPELQDDFYLNLVDWSSQNVLAVGLGNSVYLWSACTSQVTRLCDFITDSNSVTSVAWNERGNYVAVGTHHGYVQIWDVAASKLVTRLNGHTARVGALAWNGETLCSGSRDRLIFQRDIRSNPNVPERRLVGHRQEVCGLKWSPDNQYLASGGNDNRLYVWNSCSVLPIQTYAEHLAAVKAIAWSPHQHGLLASGGGTADRCIRFWNTLTGQPMQCVDTGSQVCNLAWSKHSSELVSTHGYSQNQILVWKYPSLNQVAKLTGHSYRVLYLAMSPDGESIVTGAGDETLRFWNVFSKIRSQRDCKGYAMSECKCFKVL